MKLVFKDLYVTKNLALICELYLGNINIVVKFQLLSKSLKIKEKDKNTFEKNKQKKHLN